MLTLTIKTEYGEVQDLILPDFMPKKKNDNDNVPPQIYASENVCPGCGDNVGTVKSPIWGWCCSWACARDVYS